MPTWQAKPEPGSPLISGLRAIRPDQKPINPILFLPLHARLGLGGILVELAKEKNE